jgi:pimeloyl-ACP methyl ester carboxylesterase
VHSRIWKAQIPYLSRHFRVVTFDGRGNGRSSRPTDAAAHTIQNYVDDALAVMQATRTQRAVFVGFSAGANELATLAVMHPQCVAGAIFIAPSAPLGTPLPERTVFSWERELTTSDGWAKHNRHYWLRAYDDWLRFFAGRLLTEPHSTKHIEDIVEWGRQTSPEVLVATIEAPRSPGAPPWEDRAAAPAYYARIHCPVLVIHGSDDAVIDHSTGAGVAAATGGRLVTIEGGGHVPHARDPVKVNIVIREFMESIATLEAAAHRS